MKIKFYEASMWRVGMTFVNDIQIRVIRSPTTLTHITDELFQGNILKHLVRHLFFKLIKSQFKYLKINYFNRHLISCHLIYPTKKNNNTNKNNTNNNNDDEERF